MPLSCDLLGHSAQVHANFALAGDLGELLPLEKTHVQCLHEKHTYGHTTSTYFQMVQFMSCVCLYSKNQNVLSLNPCLMPKKRQLT